MITGEEKQEETPSVLESKGLVFFTLVVPERAEEGVVTLS